MLGAVEGSSSISSSPPCRRRVASLVLAMLCFFASSPRSTSWSFPNVAPRPSGTTGVQYADLVLS